MARYGRLPAAFHMALLATAVCSTLAVPFELQKDVYHSPERRRPTGFSSPSKHFKLQKDVYHSPERRRPTGIFSPNTALRQYSTWHKFASWDCMRQKPHTPRRASARSVSRSSSARHLPADAAQSQAAPGKAAAARNSGAARNKAAPGRRAETTPTKAFIIAGVGVGVAIVAGTVFALFVTRTAEQPGGPSAA